MENRIYLFIGLFIFILTGMATAHPLGNFTINHYSRIEIEKSRVRIRAVLDMAEIPTFQESQKIDTNKDGKLSENELNAFAAQITPEYIANLQISIDGQPISLRAGKTDVAIGRRFGKFTDSQSQMGFDR